MENFAKKDFKKFCEKNTISYKFRENSLKKILKKINENFETLDERLKSWLKKVQSLDKFMFLEIIIKRKQ